MVTRAEIQFKGAVSLPVDVTEALRAEKIDMLNLFQHNPENEAYAGRHFSQLLTR